MSRRRLALVAGALAALTVVSRIPFATRYLWQWDSVLYARALDQGFHVDYILREQRPHPPGYLFYVGLAELLRSVTHDSNAALVAVSILGCALATLGVFLLAYRFAGLGPATLAAAGYAFSPLVWLYSEVAYPYALLGALAIGIASLFYAARRRSGPWVVVASVLFGLAAGFRQDVLILFSPLWLWMVWRSRWRYRAAAAVAVPLACLVWFVPSALLSGGFERYLTAVMQQSSGVGVAYSSFLNGPAALAYNLRFTLYGLAWGLFIFGVLLAALGLAPVLWWLRGRRQSRIRLHPDNVFFLVWILPPLAFYATVHIGEWGYVHTVLPALYVLVAALMPPLVRQFRGGARQAWRIAAAGFVVAGALVFLYVDNARFSADALADHDRAIAGKVTYIRANFAPDSTIVLAREDFLHVRYYLPEYRVWYYDPDPYLAEAHRHMKTPSRATTVVLFSQGLRPMRPQELRYADLAQDVRLPYFTTEPRTVLEFTGTRFSVREGYAR